MSGEAYRQMALAELAHSDTFFGQPGMEHARRLALLEEDTDETAAAEAGTPPSHSPAECPGQPVVLLLSPH